jgi:hypothetical protein
MTKADVKELQELRAQHEAMLRGRPWDMQIHDRYVKALIYHAPDLIEHANDAIND